MAVSPAAAGYGGATSPSSSMWFSALALARLDLAGGEKGAPSSPARMLLRMAREFLLLLWDCSREPRTACEGSFFNWEKQMATMAAFLAGAAAAGLFSDLRLLETSPFSPPPLVERKMLLRQVVFFVAAVESSLFAGWLESAEKDQIPRDRLSSPEREEGGGGALAASTAGEERRWSLSEAESLLWLAEVLVAVVESSWLSERMLRLEMVLGSGQLMDRLLARNRAKKEQRREKIEKRRKRREKKRKEQRAKKEQRKERKEQRRDMRGVRVIQREKRRRRMKPTSCY